MTQSNEFGGYQSTLSDNMPLPVYVIDPQDLRLVYVNRAMAEKTGGTVGQLCYQAIYQQDSPCSFCRLQEMLAAQPRNFPVTFEHFNEVDDCWYQLEEVMMPWQNHGLVKYSVAINVSELKAVQNDLAEAHAELSLKSRELERIAQAVSQSNRELNHTLATLKKTQKQLVESEKMVALGGLVAGVAHEINTPVGIGVTAASSLRDSAVDLTMRYQDGTMRKSDLEKFLVLSERTTQMILHNLERASDLLHCFKQVAVDQSSEAPRVIDIKTYLHEILTSLIPNLKKTQVTCKVNCPSNITIDCYPGAIAQIITNLVMNAIIHAYEPMQQGLITIDVLVDKQQLTMEFRDDGKGIPANIIDKIFDPFFTTKRGRGGSGLGLHIVYNLITQTLKGTITHRSEVGKGTVFVMNWPITTAIM